MTECVGKEEASGHNALAAWPTDSVRVAGWQDPCQSPEWDRSVSELAGCNIFFSSNWARVLQATYGYQPLYLAAWQGTQMTACLPLMEVAAWPTRRRGVALPFSDEVAPMAGSLAEKRSLLERAIALGRERGWRFLEVRGGGECVSEARCPAAFWGHKIDLRRTLPNLLQDLHSSVRRGIRVAERNGVEIEFTTTLSGMRAYYLLHCLTRKRHGLPPQPWSFFKAIQQHVLSLGQGFITLAKHQGRYIAGAVFLQFGKSAIYKFGASDIAHQAVRPNNLVMWESIRKLVGQGVEELSLGRTSIGNEGLRRFKQGWASSDYAMSYLKYDYRVNAFVPVADGAEGKHNAVLRHLPSAVLRLIGRVLYRYCG